jgi:hypothetical protein
MFDGVQWLDAYFIYHSVFILSLDFLARPWDEQDTPEDLARKQAIRDVMSSLQKVKLCRTFTILTQVSMQLAKIVGIFDSQPSQQERPEQFRQYMEQQQGTINFDYSTQIAQGHSNNVLQTWFQKDPVDLPWDLKDFFGTDTYVAPQAMPADHPYHGMQMPLAGGTLSGAYNGQMPDAAEGEDLLAPVPPHTAYTQWGAIDTPFAQHRGMPKPPLNPMGQ